MKSKVMVQYQSYAITWGIADNMAALYSHV